MNMGDISLDVRRLHAQIMDMLASGYVGGSGKLFRLEQDAWKCHAELTGGKKAVCAVIARFLDKIATQQDGEAVTDEDAAKLCETVRQPLTQCIDYLIGRDSGLAPEQLVAALQ